jgi:glycine dehydrogenase subunit 2
MMGVSLFGTCTMKYSPRLATELAARPEDRRAALDQDDGTPRAFSSSYTGSTDPARRVGHGRVRFQAGGGATRLHPRRDHAPITPRRAQLGSATRS